MEYKKTVELDKSFSIAYFGLGDVYLKTNRQDEAAKWYKKGLEIEPDDLLTKERLTRAESISNELDNFGIIKAESIKKLLASRTRALGEVVSIQFNERLIPFDYNKAEIRSDAMPQLNELGKALQDITGNKKDIEVEGSEGSFIEISGHTDSRGSDAYNLDLSEKRAKEVIEYLVQNYNIPRQLLKPRGYGERVPMCADESEPCYALNRRVEIAMVSGPAATRSFRNTAGQPLSFDMGFFYKNPGSPKVGIIDDEGTDLRSSDQIFFFFRPLQDSYVYILNEDNSGKLTMLHPTQDGSSSVAKGKDYWIPGFGKAYTLEGTAGQEIIYFIATTWPLESSKGTLNEIMIKDAAEGLRSQPTRAILPVGVESEATSESQAESSQASTSTNVEAFLQTIVGQGGWVKIVKFNHV